MLKAHPQSHTKKHEKNKTKRERKKRNGKNEDAVFFLPGLLSFVLLRVALWMSF
jgi:hypothetical protein